MKKEHLFKGMKIMLSQDCNHTKQHLGWNENMDKYKGTIQKIKIIDYWNGQCRIKCQNNEYDWSIKDLLPIKTNPVEKNLKTIHFNPKDLVL